MPPAMMTTGLSLRRALIIASISALRSFALSDAGRESKNRSAPERDGILARFFTSANDFLFASETVLIRFRSTVSNLRLKILPAFPTCNRSIPP